MPRNPRLADELKALPEYTRALEQAAEPARTQAERLARAAGEPWMRRDHQAFIALDNTGSEVHLVNTDYAAHLAEFGSVNNPPHAPLRRGVRAAGLRLDEQTT